MSTTTTGRPAAPEPAKAPRKDRTHYLYIAVVVAVALGIFVGLVAPTFAIELKPLGDAFVALIKMMIQPVIFCTIVLGVGSVRSASTVRWGLAGNIVWAWIFTIPASAFVAGAFYWLSLTLF